MDYSVSEYAAAKGLSRARVLQLINANQIQARKVGRQWIIPSAELKRSAEKSRPFSPRIAHEFLNLISKNELSKELDPAEVSRLRKRIEFINQSPEPASVLRSWMKNRAEVHYLHISEKEFAKMQNDKEVLISGAYAIQSGLAAVGDMDIYIEKKNFNKIKKRYLLVPSEKPNIKVRLLSYKLPKELPVGLLLSDLADINSAREDRRVKELLEAL